MNATIDGKPWVGAVSAAINVSGVISVGGSSDGLVFGFAAPAVQGSTSIGPLSSATATITAGNQAWQALGNSGSGTLNITSITATGASGTFSFTLQPVPGTGSSGNRSVTNGSFNVTF